MKKGQKQLLTLFILTSFFNIILCLGFSKGVNYEAGIKTLILKTVPREFRYDVLYHLSFEIAYQTSFDFSPQPIVSLLGFGRQIEDLKLKDNIKYISVKLAQLSALPKGIKIQVQSTLIFGTIKISYLFIDRFLADKFGISLITDDYPQNQNLVKGQENYLKISQYIGKASEPHIKSKLNEYYSSLPMSSEKFSLAVCLNQIRLKNSSYSNHNLNIYYQQSEVNLVYWHNDQENASIDKLPKYLLLVFGKEVIQKNILVQTITVSIFNEPVLNQGYNSIQLFMGIKGLDVKGGILSINKLLFQNRSTFNIEAMTEETIDLTIIKVVDGEQSAQIQKKSRRMLLACTVPLYPTIYQNYWKIGNNPVKGSVQTCQPCPTGCYTCTYCSSCLRYVNCTLCNPGFSFVKLGIDNYPSTQMVCRCPTGLFPNATTNTCMNCTSVIPYCTSCISKQSGHFSAACSSCTTGLFPVPNTGSWGGAVQCGLCVYGCTACSSATVCTTCGNGLKKDTNGLCTCSNANTYYNSKTLSCASCQLVLPNCLICTANSTTTLCSACSPGFFSTGGQCTSCPANCNNCTSTICLSCASTFISSGNSCVCNQSAQMFLNSTLNKCTACAIFISNCLDCNQTSGLVTCLGCTSGNYLNLGICLPCPSTLCTTCGTGGVCINCTSNLMVIGGTCGCDINAGSYLNVATSTCVLCSSYFPSCATCIFNTTSSALQCIACSYGYYLDIGSACLVCPATCGNCTSPTNCLDCAPGYQLNSTLCECINCVTCSSLFLNNCSDCQITVPIACTLCEIGFYLLLPGGTCEPCPIGCVSCTNSSFCGSCNLPFISTIPAGSCICNSLNLYYFDPLLLTCSTCNIVISSCLSCISIGNSTSCLDCGAGMYIDNNTCVSCTHPCSSCSSISTCISCVSTYILVNGSCVCDGINQYFESLGVTCITCNLITVSTCLLCQADPLANATQGVKCTTCATGYFPDNYICSQCPPTCQSCDGLTNCTFCQNTYSLIGGECVCDTSVSYFAHDGICMPCFAIINYCLSCSNSTNIVLCATCQIGTFLSPTQDSCILCPINCDVCTSTSVCSVCSAGYTKSLAGVCQCLTTCSTFPNADPSCISCSLQTNTSTLLCLACKTGTFLYQNQTCSSCSTTCTTCSSFSNCLVCEPSFQLVNGQCTCNTFVGQILFGSTCQTCINLIPGCTTCIIVLGVPQCSACSQGWGIDGAQCIFCGTGCLSCTVVASLVTTCDSCTAGFIPSGSICSPILANTCTSNQYFDLVNNTCINCSPNCLSCLDQTGCVLCDLTFSNIEGQCACDEGTSLFYDINLGYCVTCLSNSTLVNCKRCQSSTTNFINGIQCLDCIDGFFLSNGICTACSNGCLKCTGGASCYSCLIPAWTMVNGTCACNNDLSYFSNGTSCAICNIQHCSICNSLTTCLMCNFNYFINISGLCEVAVCNDSSTEGVQSCDDGNLINGDGCSQNCTTQPYYFCDNSLGASICVLDNRFNVQLSSIASSCNQIHISFKMFPFYSQYDLGNYDRFLRSQNSTNIIEQSYTRQYDIITYTFEITKTVQGSEISFVFDPTTLGITITSTYPLNQISLIIQPSNNMLAILYEKEKCISAESMQSLTNAIEYATYGIMAISALPCKIVGLEASGVIQLAFLSIASIDNVNVLLSPMKGLKGINGYALQLGQSSKKRLLMATPQRVSSIGYSSNFIRNCNIMLLIIGGIIFISLVLYFITFLFKNCAPCLHSASKRLIKQVLLTLILFNCFNFAYSVGLHFKYAQTDDDLYVVGTIAAISALIIPIIMAIGLAFSSQDGFGQFKDKLKNGCVQKGYFVVTIAYRSCLGLYMSSSNEDHLSTLIVLAASIAFLLYNLINLPFVKAYHNYRANICHICQFICLFIAMYYRSMKRSHDPHDISNIDAPVYIQYICICISLAVSILVLAYELYAWIKECKRPQKQRRITKIKDSSEPNIINNYKQHTLKSLDDEKVQDTLFITNE